MRAGNEVVFVEVKTQRDSDFKEPHEQVDLTKQRKLVKAAQWFLRQRRLEDRPCRFDVVGIVLPSAGEPKISHFPDAFQP